MPEVEQRLTLIMARYRQHKSLGYKRGHVNSNSPNKTLLYYLQFVIWTSDNLFKIKRGGVHNYTITLYKPCIHVCMYLHVTMSNSMDYWFSYILTKRKQSQCKNLHTGIIGICTFVHSLFC